MIIAIGPRIHDLCVEARVALSGFLESNKTFLDWFQTARETNLHLSRLYQYIEGYDPQTGQLVGFDDFHPTGCVRGVEVRYLKVDELAQAITRSMTAVFGDRMQHAAACSMLLRALRAPQELDKIESFRSELVVAIKPVYDKWKMGRSAGTPDGLVSEMIVHLRKQHEIFFEDARKIDEFFRSLAGAIFVNSEEQM